MSHGEAVSLIEKGIDRTIRQSWIDLGAGSGTFTRALAQLVGVGGIVYAVDRDAEALNSIRTSTDGASIAGVVADFTAADLSLEKVNGILIANALHYVRDQACQLTRFMGWLKPGGRIIVIEYDTDHPNRWIPYPVSYTRLESLASDLQLKVSRIGEHPSQYQEAGMYAALMTPVASTALSHRCRSLSKGRCLSGVEGS